jgi:hypothetical protein
LSPPMLLAISLLSTLDRAGLALSSRACMEECHIKQHVSMLFGYHTDLNMGF